MVVASKLMEIAQKIGISTITSAAPNIVIKTA